MSFKNFIDAKGFINSYKDALFIGFALGVFITALTSYLLKTEPSKDVFCKYELQEIKALRKQSLDQNLFCSTKIDQAKKLGFETGKKTCVDVTLEQKCNQIFDDYLKKHCQGK